MILTRTPFRVTLGGGGTDLPAYYHRHGGHVLAMALDKAMFVAVNRPVVGRKIRVNYTRNEVVERPDQLRHELARAALQRLGIDSAIEITSMADLPSATGLGSSSCYLVGLLHALRTLQEEPLSPQEQAEEACDIEINQLRSSVGKQDPYLAAFGGMTVLEIEPSGAVKVRPARTERSTLDDFIANTQLYWTGLGQEPEPLIRGHLMAVEAESSPSHQVVLSCLHAIRETSYGITEAIESGNYDEFGRLMDVHWQHKKNMSSKISIPGIDELYAEVKKRFGVLGGKVAGAGGGGFFMVYAPREHEAIHRFMAERGLERLRYRIADEGVSVLAGDGAAMPARVLPRRAAEGKPARDADPSARER